MIDPIHLSMDITPTLYDKVLYDVEQMIEVYFSNNDFWEFTVYSFLLPILTSILAHTLNEGTKKSLCTVAKKIDENYIRFLQLLSYIDLNYSNDITLEVAASFLGFSITEIALRSGFHNVTTFQRSFKKMYKLFSFTISAKISL